MGVSLLFSLSMWQCVPMNLEGGASVGGGCVLVWLLTLNFNNLSSESLTASLISHNTILVVYARPYT